MAKEKIFKPEDFDKEPRNPKKGYWKWILKWKWIPIGGIIIVIIAVLFGISRCKSNHPLSSAPLMDSVNIHSTSDSLNTLLEDPSSQTPDSLNNQDSQEMKEKATISKVSSDASAPVKSQTYVETQALRVIRGEYGNNPRRKSVLGADYQIIQNRVNELKRKGVF